jgi:hypothetical protein
MKKPNSKFRVEVSKTKTDNERSYCVIETQTNSVISTHKNRQDAQHVMDFQIKTPSFGKQSIPSFFKEPL